MSDGPSNKKNWVLRTFFIVSGALLVFTSGYGIFHGILWVPSSRNRFGARGIQSLGMLLLFGALLIAMGVLVNDSPTKRPRRKRR